MKYFITMIPAIINKRVICMAGDTPVDHRFNNVREMIGWMAKDGSYFDRAKMREYAFGIDENAAEHLNTSHIIFVGYSKPNAGFCSLPIGRSLLFGPIIACTSKYDGFSKLEPALAQIEYIIATSTGEADIGEPKTLDEMMKEYGSKHVD